MSRPDCLHGKSYWSYCEDCEKINQEGQYAEWINFRKLITDNENKKMQIEEMHNFLKHKNLVDEYLVWSK